MSQSSDESTARRGRRGPHGCAAVIIGVVLVLIGIPMLVLPGPGIGAIIIGAGLIATGLGGRRS